MRARTVEKNFQLYNDAGYANAKCHAFQEKYYFLLLTTIFKATKNKN